MASAMRIINKILGFFRPRKQIEHKGTSTKSYCSNFGGAFGGSTKKKSSRGRIGYIGAKSEKRLHKKIVREGGVIKI